MPLTSILAVWVRERIVDRRAENKRARNIVFAQHLRTQRKAHRARSTIFTAPQVRSRNQPGIIAWQVIATRRGRRVARGAHPRFRYSAEHAQRTPR